MPSKDLRAQYTEETSMKAECTVVVEDQAEVWAESAHAEKGFHQVIRVWKHSKRIAKVKYTDNYNTINTIRKRQWCLIATISESWRNQKTSEKPNCSTLKITLMITKKTWLRYIRKTPNWSIKRNQWIWITQCVPQQRKVYITMANAINFNFKIWINTQQPCDIVMLTGKSI